MYEETKKVILREIAYHEERAKNGPDQFVRSMHEEWLNGFRYAQMTFGKFLAHSVIETRRPYGLFAIQDGDRWVAIDNSTGDAFTEEFQSKEAACDWLLGGDGKKA